MGEWEYGNNMEKILLNGLLDAGIFYGFRRNMEIIGFGELSWDYVSPGLLVAHWF